MHSCNISVFLCEMANACCNLAVLGGVLLTYGKYA